MTALSRRQGALMGHHRARIRVLERDGNHRATSWVGTCECGADFFGDTLDAVDLQYAQHSRAIPLHVLEGSAPVLTGGAG